MHQAPVMKSSGLKPPEESKSSDQTVHIFGSNLESRVVTGDSGEESKPLIFSPTEDPKKEDDIDTIRKRKFDAITGEEDEETVFQGDFKLFAWDLASSNWIEKGRGQLKLNDSLDQEKNTSRIIMRVGGTLKIVLNVAIRHSTFRVIASSKTSIRFTDSQTVWAASGSNAGTLRELIDERIEMAEEREAEVAKKKKPKTNEIKENNENNQDQAEANEAEASKTNDTEPRDTVSDGKDQASPEKESDNDADDADQLDGSESASEGEKSPHSDHDRDKSNSGVSEQEEKTKKNE